MENFCVNHFYDKLKNCGVHDDTKTTKIPITLYLKES